MTTHHALSILTLLAVFIFGIAGTSFFLNERIDHLEGLLENVVDVVEYNDETLLAVGELALINADDSDEVPADMDGTYRLMALDPMGNTWSGTATPIACELIDGRYHVTFLTAKHCLGDEGTVYTIDQGYLTPTVGAGSGGHGHPSLDVAVIVCVCFDAIKPRGISYEEPAFGDRVFVCGFPSGVGPYLTEGFYSGDGRISASAFPGSSGSAVCNERGQVVGVLTAGYAEGFQFIDFMVLEIPTAEFRTWLAGQC